MDAELQHMIMHDMQLQPNNKSPAWNRSYIIIPAALLAIANNLLYYRGKHPH